MTILSIGFEENRQRQEQKTEADPCGMTTRERATDKQRQYGMGKRF
jgi:hypothetical protein